MGRRRGKSGFEEMGERPGFRSTFDQREWLEDARIAEGALSLSEWLRAMAIAAGERALGKPYPKRKPTEPPKSGRGDAAPSSKPARRRPK